MPEVIEQTEEVVFDPKAFMEARNSGKEPEKPKAETRPEIKAPEPEHESRLPRSQRRQLNAAIREAAEARGRLAAFEELIAAGKIQVPSKEAPAEDAEPVRAQYSSDAEFLRATQKWDKAQEAKTASKTSEESQQAEQLKTHLKAMDEKALDDIKSLSDWDEVRKAAEEDGPEFIPDEHPTLMALLSRSDMRAFAMYHFAKHPEDFESMLELTAKPQEQIRSFHRLEGRLEKMYSDTKAAQASEPEKAKEDRKHLAEEKPAKATPGETAADREVRKPKPSSEVAARGGSPAPDEPAIGSPAWMLKRNQAQYGH